MPQEIKPKLTRRNKLGLWGWISGGRYGIERYLYTLQRLTGLGILLYLIMHLFVTGFKIRGREAWESTMGKLTTPFTHIMEYVLFAAILYHAMNGLRLILTEFGFFLGTPRRPIYPYVTSIMRQRPLMVVLMIIAFVIILIGGLDFFILPK